MTVNIPLCVLACPVWILGLPVEKLNRLTQLLSLYYLCDSGNAPFSSIIYLRHIIRGQDMHIFHLTYKYEYFL